MSTAIETQFYESLSDIPRIDVPQNLNLALSIKRDIFQFCARSCSCGADLADFPEGVILLSHPGLVGPFEQNLQLIGQGLKMPCTSLAKACSGPDRPPALVQDCLSSEIAKSR